jgi:tungstate transport system substrate-binding protein
MRRPLVLLALACVACGGGGSGGRLLVGATHTLEDSGLLDVLLAAIDSTDPGLDVQVIVAGSGEILQYGRRGDLDMLIAHAPDDEARFMDEGYGVDRRVVMWNEFLLLAPPSDPAGVMGVADGVAAFRAVARSGAPFVSRGDLSGTHQRELALWDSAGARPAPDVYLEAGAGMADALRVASSRHAYILSDVATFTVLEPELDLVIAARGDPRLLNVYSVIRVARGRHADAARRIADWLTGDAARAVIAGFGTEGGRPRLFNPGSPPPADSAGLSR